eukprot:3372451-Prorocentrum_lima.AAC.1
MPTVGCNDPVEGRAALQASVWRCHYATHWFAFFDTANVLELDVALSGLFRPLHRSWDRPRSVVF